MAQYDVYLRQRDRNRAENDPEYRSTFSEAIPELWEQDGEYLRVATVEAEDLDEAYMLTNSIDHPWDQNPEVEFLAPTRDSNTARSLSVGDVLVDLDTDQAFMVDRLGFKTLPKRLGESVDPKKKIREEVRKTLLGLIFENYQAPYWITRGTKHRYGFDGPSGFKDLAIVEFNESSNQFDVFLMKEGVEEYIGSSGDISRARKMVIDAVESDSM